MSLLHLLMIISHANNIFLLLKIWCLFIHVYDILIVPVPDEREQFRDCHGGVRGRKHQEIRQPCSSVIVHIGKYYSYRKILFTGGESIRRYASLTVVLLFIYENVFHVGKYYLQGVKAAEGAPALQ